MHELREGGFLVSKTEVVHKYAKEKDCFGLFDLVAISEEGPVRFIQITCNRPHSHKTYDSFAAKYKQIAVEQWVWVDREGFRYYTY